MISIIFDSRDFFSNIGMEHFIQRSGLPVKINNRSGFGITIFYDIAEGTKDEQPTIRMMENTIQNKICGRVSGFSRMIPVCQVSHNTGYGDEVIASFKDGNFQYPCITRNNGNYSIGIDIFRETGYLISGHLDTMRDSIDQSLKNEIATLPAVDFLEDMLLAIIRLACNARNLPLVQKSYWPDGKSFAVCLTHDVDELTKTYQWLSRPLRFFIHGDFTRFNGQVRSLMQKLKGHEPYYTYDDIINIEKSLGVKSTYFILKETGNVSLRLKKTWYLYGRNRSFQSPEMVALIHRLLANGDEIGVHGSYFSYKDPELFNRETRELEQVTGERLTGNRQHNLNMDIPRTWEYHVRAGLTYDTSLGFKDTIGFRWGTAFPFHPNNGKETLPLLEIPLTIMDVCLDSCQEKERECLHLADVVESCHGVLTLLWHPPIFNRLEYPGLRDIYIRINQYCLEKGAWIGRAKDISEWSDDRIRNTIISDYNPSTKTIIIIPKPITSNHYLTIYLPDNATCEIRSENAQIVKNDGNCVHIKTHNLEKDERIVVGIA